jgi:hypothetical protein
MGEKASGFIGTRKSAAGKSSHKKTGSPWNCDPEWGEERYLKCDFEIFPAAGAFRPEALRPPCLIVAKLVNYYATFARSCQAKKRGALYKAAKRNHIHFHYVFSRLPVSS